MHYFQIGDKVQLRFLPDEVGEIIGISGITKHASIVWMSNKSNQKAKHWPFHALKLYKDAIDKLDEVL